jgi:hypothetical protein
MTQEADLPGKFDPGTAVYVLPEADVQEQKVRYEALLDSLGRPSAAATKQFLRERELAEPEDGLSAEMIASVEAKIANHGR